MPKAKTIKYGGLEITPWSGDKNHILIPTFKHDIWFPEEQARAIGIALKENISCLLIGETGTGKTSAVRELAFLRKQPYVRVNLHGYTSPDELIGSKSASQGSTYFEKGVIIKAMEEGAILVVDELNAATPDCMFIFHALLDDDRKITLQTGEVVKPHPEFRFFATMNPDYEGTKSINRAFMDRFGIVLHIDHMSPDKEEQYLVERGIDAANAHNMVLFATSYRAAHKEGKTLTYCSTRSLLQWGDLIKTGMSLEDAFIYAVAGKARQDEKQALMDVFSATVKINLGLAGKDTLVVIKLSEIDKLKKSLQLARDKVRSVEGELNKKDVHTQNMVARIESLENAVQQATNGKPIEPKFYLSELVEYDLMDASKLQRLNDIILEHRAKRKASR